MNQPSLEGIWAQLTEEQNRDDLVGRILSVMAA
jgi:hypothetical protein